jgi:hypothetical protein
MWMMYKCKSQYMYISPRPHFAMSNRPRVPIDIIIVDIIIMMMIAPAPRCL